MCADSLSYQAISVRPSGSSFYRLWAQYSAYASTRARSAAAQGTETISGDRDDGTALEDEQKGEQGDRVVHDHSRGVDSEGRYQSRHQSGHSALESRRKAYA